MNEMEMNEINFLDKEGNLLPLEDVQQQIADIYNQVEEEIESENCMFENNSEMIEPTVLLDDFCFKDRNLQLTSEIRHEHAILFCDTIRYWNELDDRANIPIEERQPIKIYIDSPGGDLDATLSIVDSITLSKTPVWTITIGSGDSGGFFIGLAGHKRIGYPHSSYLFHEGGCGNEGDAHKYIQFVEFYKKKLSMLKELVLEKTDFSIDDYEEHRKDDLWLTAKDALRYKVIDEIAEKLI